MVYDYMIGLLMDVSSFSLLLHPRVHFYLSLHVLISILFDMEMWVFVVDVVDAVEEVLDDSLSRLSVWIVYRFYGRLAVYKYTPLCPLVIVPQYLYR